MLTPPGLGWIVTYIINERNGGSNSGYISSGFWGGLTAGRICLLWFNKKVRHGTPLGVVATARDVNGYHLLQIGDYRVVFIYTVLVLA